jgi:cation transporter-like permease
MLIWAGGYRPTPRIDPKVVPRTLVVIWCTFAAAVGVYILIARVMVAQGAKRPSGDPFAAVIYNPGLIILTVAALALGLAIERFRLHPDRLAAARADGPSAVAQRYLGTAIVQLAIYESVAIWGFLYFLMGGSFANMVEFCIIAWGLLGILLLKLPRYIAAVRRASAESSGSSDLWGTSENTE